MVRWNNMRLHMCRHTYKGIDGLGYGGSGCSAWPSSQRFIECWSAFALAREKVCRIDEKSWVEIPADQWNLLHALLVSVAGVTVIWFRRSIHLQSRKRCICSSVLWSFLSQFQATLNLNWCLKLKLFWNLFSNFQSFQNSCTSCCCPEHVEDWCFLNNK